MHGHANTSAAGIMRAVLSESLHLAVVVNLVELENGKLDAVVHVLDLLWLGVGLLLTLLGTTSQTKHQVEGGLLLDVVVREGAAILELLASEDQLFTQKKVNSRSNGRINHTTPITITLFIIFIHRWSC